MDPNKLSGICIPLKSTRETICQSSAIIWRASSFHEMGMNVNGLLNQSSEPTHSNIFTDKDKMHAANQPKWIIQDTAVEHILLFHKFLGSTQFFKQGYKIVKQFLAEWTYTLTS